MVGEYRGAVGVLGERGAYATEMGTAEVGVDRGLVAKVFVERELSWLVAVFVEQEGVDTALGAGGGQEFLEGMQEVVAFLGCGELPQV
jgi:hypothetical protein